MDSGKGVKAGVMAGWRWDGATGRAIRPAGRAAAAGLALATLMGVSGPAEAACPRPPGGDALLSRLHASIDAERRRAGLPGLRGTAALNRAAQAHACDNARRARMSHSGSDGSNPGDRIRRVGYRLSAANENLAVGFTDPGAVVSAWMRSPSHRRNVVASNVTELGIGLARGADGRLHWVMKAATPR
ncbi:MAG: CAP domain-containing protein [Alkalilacustris sp.]